jgi:hypothetical protein
MKYNEAIDMILDGGEAYRAAFPGWLYRFDDFELKESDKNDGWSNEDDSCHFLKDDFIENDWIVKKDGVVYEEYPHAKKALCFICGEPVDNGDSGWSFIINSKGDSYRYKHNKCDAYIKDRIGTEDPPAELENNNQKWEKIKMPIQIDEEWLEKKMRCFIYKITRTDTGGCLYWQPKDKCRVKDCPFCFPDVSKEDKAQGAIDQPRKKVTVKHMDDLLQKIRGIAYKRGALRQAWLDADEMDYINDFQQNLEYLVSLQGE